MINVSQRWRNVLATMSHRHIGHRSALGQVSHQVGRPYFAPLLFHHRTEEGTRLVFFFKFGSLVLGEEFSSLQ